MTSYDKSQSYDPTTNDFLIMTSAYLANPEVMISCTTLLITRTHLPETV
jgi:hypothetical protein